MERTFSLQSRSLTTTLTIPPIYIFLLNFSVEKPKSVSPLNIYAIRVTPVDAQRSANVSLLMDSMTAEHVVIIKRTGMNWVGSVPILCKSSSSAYSIPLVHTCLLKSTSLGGTN